MKSSRNPVGWFEIYVQDMARARTFYETTFQVSLAPLESPDPAVEMLAFPPVMAPDNPGCSGALARMKDKDSGTGGTIIYFSCEDCSVETRRSVEAGGKVLFEKKPIGDYGFISHIYDTEGNMIGLHSMK